MEIVQQIFEIIVRKRQPQDITYNATAALIFFVGVVTLGTVVYSKVPQFSQPFAYNLCMAVVQALAIFSILHIRGKSNRFVQTLSAILGVSLVLNILSIGASLIPGLAAIGLLLSIWNFVLIVFILRAALECSTFIAVLQTIGFNLVIILALSLLFPEFPKEIQAMVQAATPVEQ